MSRSALFLCLLAAGCCCRSTASFSSGRGQSLSSPVEMQNLLHEGLRPFPKEYRNAGNDIQKSDVYRRANEWRRAFARDHGTDIRGWQAVVSDISTTKGGDRASVSLRSEARGFRVYYKSGMVVERGSKLYHTLEVLKEGASVTFSGSFVPDEEKGYRELSLTERGSLDEPWFLVTFSDIQLDIP